MFCGNNKRNCQGSCGQLLRIRQKWSFQNDSMMTGSLSSLGRVRPALGRFGFLKAAVLNASDVRRLSGQRERTRHTQVGMDLMRGALGRCHTGGADCPPVDLYLSIAHVPLPSSPAPRRLRSFAPSGMRTQTAADTAEAILSCTLPTCCSPESPVTGLTNEFASQA